MIKLNNSGIEEGLELFFFKATKLFALLVLGYFLIPIILFSELEGKRK